MSKKDIYKTVQEESETLLIEKKSKFYSHVKPVSSESEALEYLAKMRSQYADATHNVYAYVIDENNICRYSDDGEPGGTAGMPVLDMIRGSGLVDVIVVITRYFGGTLLGTGGLVRAYGASARQGLSASGIVTKMMCNIVSVKIDYDLVGKLQYFFANGGYIIRDTVYENDVTFFAAIPVNDTEKFMRELTELTNGRAEAAVAAQQYVDIKEGGNENGN